MFVLRPSSPFKTAQMVKTPETATATTEVTATELETSNADAKVVSVDAEPQAHHRHQYGAGSTRNSQARRNIDAGLNPRVGGLSLQFGA